MNKDTMIERIGKRIAQLQQAHIVLQEAFKQTEQASERHLNEMALRVIDVLDLIDSIAKDVNPSVTIIRKIEKRLIALLEHWQIEEIILKEGRVEVGKTRVLETQLVLEDRLPGTILEVCRKGYQRRDKVIRSVDVITAAGPKFE